MEVSTVLMLLLIAVMEFVGVVACPVEHECEGFGLEDLGTGTGEAAFCNGPQATPYCPGVYINGTVIEDNTSPPYTTTSDGDTAANTTTTLDGDTAANTTTTWDGDTAANTTTTTTSDGDTAATTTTSDGDTAANTTTTSDGDTAANTTTTSDGDTAANTTTTSSVVSCQPATCNGKPEGIYYHPDCDCQRYYTCLKALGNPAILTQNNYRCCGNYYIDAEKHFCTEDISVCTTD